MIMTRDEYQQYIMDNENGFQVDWPVFVKVPFQAFGKHWKPGEYYNWQNQQFSREDYRKVKNNVHRMYNQGWLHHDSSKEVKYQVGDRLHELNGSQMYRLVSQLNSILKKKTTTKKEYDDTRCPLSKIEHKQRAQLRRFLKNNPWIHEDFKTYRDMILGESHVIPQEEPQEKPEVTAED